MKREFFLLVLVSGLVMAVLGVFVFEKPPSRYVIEAEPLNESEACDGELESLSDLPEQDREAAREAIRSGSSESVSSVDSCVEYRGQRYDVGPAVALDTFPPDWYRWLDIAAMLFTTVGAGGLVMSRWVLGPGEDA